MGKKMTKKDENLKDLTKKIISKTLEESLEATMKVQDIINEEPNKKEVLKDDILKKFDKEKNELKLRRLITTASVFEIEGSEKYLRKLLDHENGLIMEEATLALGILKDEKSIDTLIKILKNEDHIAREEAAVSLGLMGQDIAVDPLINQLDDDNVDLVIASCLALSELQNPKALRPLIRKVVDDNKYIRKYASKAVFTFGRTALKPLKEALKEDLDDMFVLKRIYKRRYINKLIKEIDQSDLTEVKKTYPTVKSTS
ncbi:MAG: hypothetical protein GF329_04030 [Candidatus Lokiarchaeota archaeon]|nr:hypothetical protein [Candidatus Lokiarchaeota archaeon]